MIDTQIHEGDNVSWKWGGGQPSGTVAEVKTGGQLEIESKGKLVHKNADPSNPAVHVERSGNDVVKRASELTKLDSSAVGDSGDQAEASSTKELGHEDVGEEKEKPAPKKRGLRKKSDAAANAGEKRAAEEDAHAAEGTTDAVGTKAKKAKTAKADAGGEKKLVGRPRKGSKAKKVQEEKAYAEGETVVDNQSGSAAEPTVVKKRGPGRPKKSDASDYPHAEHAPVNEDAPAANTRSKE